MSTLTDDQTSPPSPRRLIIWCVPRSCSTALAKCLSHVDDVDTEVWMEPFNSCRTNGVRMKKEVGLDVPKAYAGNEQVFQTMTDVIQRKLGSKIDIDPRLYSYEGVRDALENSQHRTVVVKEMAVASFRSYDFFPKGFRHILLIRDPLRVIPSFRRALAEQLGNVTDDDSLEEIHKTYPTLHWYGEMHELWMHLKATYDRDPLIIDADELLSDPGPYLKKICDVIGNEYRDDLLTWDASTDILLKRWRHPMIQAGVWKSGIKMPFLDRALTSSCFVQPTSPKPRLGDLTPDCVRIIHKCEDIYLEMFEHRYIPKI